MGFGTEVFSAFLPLFLTAGKLALYLQLIMGGKEFPSALPVLIDLCLV